MSEAARQVFSREQALEVLGEDEELLCEMAGILLEQLPEDIAALRTAVLSSDPHAINRTAHRIKGAVASFGGGIVAATALELERAGGDGDVDRSSALLAEFERDLELFCEQLSACIQQIAANSSP